MTPSRLLSPPRGGDWFFIVYDLWKDCCFLREVITAIGSCVVIVSIGKCLLTHQALLQAQNKQKKTARLWHSFVFCIDVKRRTTPDTFKLWCPFRNAIFPHPCLPYEGYRNRANRGEEKEKFDNLTKNIMILIHNLCTNKKNAFFWYDWLLVSVWGSNFAAKNRKIVALWIA